MFWCKRIFKEKRYFNCFSNEVERKFIKQSLLNNFFITNFYEYNSNLILSYSPSQQLKDESEIVSTKVTQWFEKLKKEFYASLNLLEQISNKKPQLFDFCRKFMQIPTDKKREDFFIWTNKVSNINSYLFQFFDKEVTSLSSKFTLNTRNQESFLINHQTNQRIDLEMLKDNNWINEGLILFGEKSVLFDKLINIFQKYGILYKLVNNNVDCAEQNLSNKNSITIAIPVSKNDDFNSKLMFKNLFYMMFIIGALENEL
ncbi:hypothetical protein [Mycoplasmopsis columbinasalis]|nr:hypothetical protein [Mycoplasmopsis columbinasalis]